MKTTKRNYFKLLNPNELGVTMLMSILILSGMFIVTLTVSYFAVQELRASRSSTLTEPAIVAAETAGEQGIWLIKRNTFADTCPYNNPTRVDGTTNSIGNPAKTLTTKCVAFGAAVFELEPSEVLTFYLYDPNDINGNLCLEADDTTPPCGGSNQLYRNINITRVDGNFSVTMEAGTLDVSNNNIGSVTINSASPNGTILVPADVPASDDERMIVTVTNTDAVNRATVSITTSAPAPWGINGMPDFPTVDAEGCASLSDLPDCDDSREVFKRRINITVPR